MGTPLISIIMPVRNAAPFIAEAIASVLAQTWAEWELLVVDNGSDDDGPAIVKGFNDPRITLLLEPEAGVSRARNKALDHARGSYLCFLDADDMLPPESLRTRAAMLQADPALMFVDGAVLIMDKDMRNTLREHRPTYRGPALPALMRIDPGCFFGNTWMIRRPVPDSIRFPTHMRISEDLAYYLRHAHRGSYAHTNGTVLHYRTGHRSSTTDHAAVIASYWQVLDLVTDLEPSPLPADIRALQLRVRGIMVRDHLKHFRFNEALRAWIRLTWPPSAARA